VWLLDPLILLTASIGASTSTRNRSGIKPKSRRLKVTIAAAPRLTGETKAIVQSLLIGYPPASINFGLVSSCFPATLRLLHSTPDRISLHLPRRTTI
jgi:hypothetical protein